MTDRDESRNLSQNLSQNLSHKKYYAFISYRHADNKQQGRQWATWLHQALETYEVPADLAGNQNARGDVIPPRIYPIFRDEEELPAHADLGHSIVKALEDSQLLIVLCSPRAVASTYVADEIAYFKKLGHSERIIAALIDGEPNASWDQGKQQAGFSQSDECFPTPLQFEYDSEGNQTDKHAEPIAADFRINNNGKPEQGWTSPGAYRQHLKSSTHLDNAGLNNAEIDKKVSAYQQQQQLMLLKIIAGILGVPLGELTKRDKQHQLNIAKYKEKILRRWLTGVVTLATIAVLTGLFAYTKQLEAERSKVLANENRLIAESNEKLAVERTDQALLRESQVIAEKSNSLYSRGRFQKAALLAMEGLPLPYSQSRPEYEPLKKILKQVSLLPFRKIFKQFPLNINHFEFDESCKSYLVDQKFKLLTVDIDTNRIVNENNFKSQIVSWGTNIYSRKTWISLQNGEFYFIENGHHVLHEKFQSPVVYYDESDRIQAFRLENMKVVIREKENYKSIELNTLERSLGSTHAWGDNAAIYVINDDELYFDLEIYSKGKIKLAINNKDTITDVIFNPAKNEIAFFSGSGKSIALNIYSLNSYTKLSEINISEIEKRANSQESYASGLESVKLTKYNNESTSWAFEFLVGTTKFSIFLSESNNLESAYAFEKIVEPYDIALLNLNKSLLNFPTVLSKGKRVMIGHKDISSNQGQFYEHENNVEKLLTCKSRGILGSLSKDGEIVISKILNSSSLEKIKEITHPKLEFMTTSERVNYHLNSWPLFDWQDKKLYTVSIDEDEKTIFSIYDLQLFIERSKVIESQESKRKIIHKHPLESTGFYYSIFKFSRYIIINDFTNKNLLAFDSTDFSFVKSIALPSTPSTLPVMNGVHELIKKDSIYLHFDNNEVYKLDENLVLTKMMFESSTPVVARSNGIFYAYANSFYKTSIDGSNAELITSTTNKILNIYVSANDDFALLISSDGLLTKVNLKNIELLESDNSLTGLISDFSFSEKLFAHIDSKGYIILTDLLSMKTNKKIWVGNDSSTVRFSKDGEMLLVFGELTPLKIYDTSLGIELYSSESAKNGEEIFPFFNLDAEVNLDYNRVFLAGSSGVKLFNIGPSISEFNYDSMFEYGECVASSINLSAVSEKRSACNCLSPTQRETYLLKKLSSDEIKHRRCD